MNLQPARAVPHYPAARGAAAAGDPPRLVPAAAGGLAAAAAAGTSMTLLRHTLYVRSVPERLLEWLLLFLPPGAFEAAIQRFGFDSKRYALYGAIMMMLAVLAALGGLALARRWPAWALLALGLGLWLFTMVVVMPLTGAGLFAVALIQGTKAAVAGYLAVALTYAAVLALFRDLFLWRGAAAPAAAGAAWRGAVEAPRASRRAAALLVGAAAAAYAATLAAVRWGPKDRLTAVIVRDPQEPVPSGGLEQPNPHPNRVERSPVARPPAGGGTAGGLEPPPPRQITRDKDGAALPSGREAGELADLITTTEEFYVVTKNAGGDPMITLKEWRLRIDGDVQRPVEVDYASLRKLPAVEVVKTLECISNFVAKCELAPFGCDLISTARWKGVRVRDVLALAGGPKPDVVSLATFAADEFTTALPIEVALSPDTLLVYEMNGQVLLREHGYPLRMLVPGHYGMKNAKWIVALRAMRREFVDWYGQRNWSRTAVVKTMTRIDVPARGAVLAPGPHRVAGIAYAGDRGIAKVEYSADGGATWEVAEFLEPPAGKDVWVRWQGRFSLAPGAETTLVARATDGTGALQPEAFSLSQPDGGAGWHSLDVRASRA